MTRTDRPIEDYPVAADLPEAPPAPEVDAAQPAAAAPSRPPVEIAVLEFLSADGVRASVPLTHPFRWDGREGRELLLQRLSLLRVGQIWADVERRDDYELYAAMCGLPAPVLRGMMREDREALAAAADPLLDLEAGKAPSGDTPASGGVSLSSPAAS